MLVHLDGADKYYGARRVLASVTATVRTGAKIGVIGPNGGGKSTLLRLLAGKDEPDGGRRDTARDVTVGYLGQLVAFAPEHEARTVEAYLRDALDAVDALASRVQRLEQQLSRPDVQADETLLAQTMERYAAATARFEQAGGYEADARLRATAFGLGFGEEDLHRRVGALSGGQKVRLALARLLLSEPDLLLLDEPTNHLDTETTEWLESFLQRADRAFVVVSHDRYFLDAVTEQTWDVDGGGVVVYPAPYTRAQTLKLERLQRQQALHDRQQAEMERLEQFVDRYRAGIKSRQARGRAAQLARMERVEAPVGTVYDEDAAMAGMGRGRAARRAGRDGRGAGGRGGGRQPSLRFQGAAASGRTGREALRARAVSKAFGEHTVLQAVDVLAERGQRIGVIGPNGSGKTTLLRLLAGDLAPDTGEIAYGSGVRLGYFAQGQQDLEPERTVAEHMLAENDLTVEALRRHLARFLFFGDEIHAPVGRLSGGERNRVALARLILRQPNVLLLDEPTNHLDVTARIALEGALTEFDGVIVAVSHDRYFLESVCDRLWIVEASGVDAFVGSYSQWAEARDATRAAERERARKRAVEPRAERRQQSRDEQRRRRQLTARVAEIEGEIEALETEQEMQAELLGDPELYADEERAKAAVEDHKQTEAKLAQLLEQWEQLSTELDGL